MATKTEIREFLRYTREDLQQLGEALKTGKPRQLALFLNRAEGALEEVRELIEEKYGEAYAAAEAAEFGEEEEGEEELEEEDEDEDASRLAIHR